ncbi:uncharacterized protein KY384_000461 [Bacidia gigantensis]|uniref:uncharacterized protein n=1 Tax=Bacidia gigantensis TaxID=2732470 RepID=UPI001D0599CE|nr:uncharacterized protein KY384_000461 [Bacidia gigantensis]KAG8525701.1 hypothetical protein KY384_000461 [Bacidia gigantensis]
MTSTSSPSSETAFAQACDLCRRMKIKCDRKDNECVHCLTTGSECVFALIERKQPKVKRPEQLSVMEERIARMEAIIMSSGLDRRYREPTPDNADDEELADKFSSLVFDGSGKNARYISPASNYSLLSPPGIRWITQKVGSKDLETVMAEPSLDDLATWRDFKAELYQPLPDKEREPLPNIDTAIEYVECFFADFNTVHPLFNRTIFNSYLYSQYSAQPSEDVAWYAAFNVVLAIGTMQQQMRVLKANDLGPILNHRNRLFTTAWRYFRNASSLFIDLTFQYPNVVSVQAMLGMAFMLQTLPEPQPSYTMIAAACQLSQRLGLHTPIRQKAVSLEELEQRQNLFWIAYSLDKIACLRSGCPPTLHDEDIGVRLPGSISSSLSPSPTSSPREPSISLFRIRCELSLIEGRVYSELYSARSRLRSSTDRLAAIAQLDKEIESLKNRTPKEYCLQNEMSCDNDFIDTVLVLNFAYYECLQTIHRASPFYRSWYNEDSQLSPPPKCPEGLNPRVFSSTVICLDAARSSINLLRYCTLPRRIHDGPRPGGERNKPLMWNTLHDVLSATLSLFVNLLQNIEDENAERDVQLIRIVADFLGTYHTHHQSRSTANTENDAHFAAANRTILIFQTLVKTATTYIEKNKPRKPTKKKRGRDPAPTPSQATTSSNVPSRHASLNQKQRPIRKASASVSLSSPSRSTTESPHSSGLPPSRSSSRAYTPASQHSVFDTFIPLSAASMIAQPMTTTAPGDPSSSAFPDMSQVNTPYDMSHDWQSSQSIGPGLEMGAGMGMGMGIGISMPQHMLIPSAGAIEHADLSMEVPLMMPGHVQGYPDMQAANIGAPGQAQGLGIAGLQGQVVWGMDGSEMGGWYAGAGVGAEVGVGGEIGEIAGGFGSENPGPQPQEWWDDGHEGVRRGRTERYQDDG